MPYPKATTIPPLSDSTDFWHPPHSFGVVGVLGNGECIGGLDAVSSIGLVVQTAHEYIRRQIIEFLRILSVPNDRRCLRRPELKEKDKGERNPK